MEEEEEEEGEGEGEGGRRKKRKAEVVCYDPHCTSRKDGRPVSMCLDCHQGQHGRDGQMTSHVFQGQEFI